MARRAPGRRPGAWVEPGKPGPGGRPLATVALDGLLDRFRNAVVHEHVEELHSHERLGAELARRRHAVADVGQLVTHVVQQEIRIGVDPLEAKRGDPAVPGGQVGRVAVGTPDVTEQPLPVAGLVGGRLWRHRGEEPDKGVGGRE
jgi:hypothetical protein